MTMHKRSRADGYGNNTPMQLGLRLWLGAEIFFAFVASLATFFTPTDAATNFAWPIPVTVMAATLGVFYFSSLPVTIWSVMQKRWQEVRILAIPLGVFAFFMTLMTFMHWDKFSKGTAPFYVWMVSYIVPPIIFPYFFYTHQRQSAPVGTELEAPMPKSTVKLLWVNGIFLTLAALAIFILPNLLVDHAPFKLTPLTARTLSNMVLAAGVVQCWMAYEADWKRVKLAVLLLVLVPIGFCVQLGRFSGQVDWSNIPMWVLLGDSTVVGVWLAYGWFRGR